jgi:hypothetical protein
MSLLQITRELEVPASSHHCHGRHFDRSIIILCVRWYITYKLSYRDLVEMMAERGVAVSHTTIPAVIFQASRTRKLSPAGRPFIMRCKNFPGGEGLVESPDGGGVSGRAEFVGGSFGRARSGGHDDKIIAPFRFFYCGLKLLTRLDLSFFTGQITSSSMKFHLTGRRLWLSLSAVPHR